MIVELPQTDFDFAKPTKRDERSADATTPIYHSRDEKRESTHALYVSLVHTHVASNGQLLHDAVGKPYTSVLCIPQWYWGL